MVGDGLLYPGLLAPSLYGLVGCLLAGAVEDVCPFALTAVQYGFGLGAERQVLVFAGLLLHEVEVEVLVLPLDVAPFKLGDVAEPQACHAGEEEHLSYGLLPLGDVDIVEALDFTLGEEAFLVFGFLGSLHSLEYAVVEEFVLVGVVEHAGELLEVEADGSALEALALHVGDEVLQVGGGDVLEIDVAVVSQVLQHQAVGDLGFLFDCVRFGEVACVLRKAYRHMFFRLLHPEVGFIAVLGFGRGRLGFDGERNVSV